MRNRLLLYCKASFLAALASFPDKPAARTCVPSICLPDQKRRGMVAAKLRQKTRNGLRRSAGDVLRLIRIKTIIHETRLRNYSG